MTEIDIASDQEHAERGGTAATDLQLESEQRAMQILYDYQKAAETTREAHGQKVPLPSIQIYSDLPREWPMARLAVSNKQINRLVRTFLWRRVTEQALHGSSFIDIPDQINQAYIGDLLLISEAFAAPLSNFFAFAKNGHPACPFITQKQLALYASPRFWADGKESYPKAVRVPANPRGEIADRAFYAAPSIRRVEVAIGIQHIGIAAWQSCQQLQIVKLPPSVISLAEGTFMGCYVLREVAAPGCVQYGQRVFAECCSLGSVGVSHETEDSSVLAPGAQLGKHAFESCLTLTTITFDMDRTNRPRALPEGAFCGAGIEQLCLPNDFHNIGPRACENCKSLVEVNLMSTEVTALLSSTQYGPGTFSEGGLRRRRRGGTLRRSPPLRGA